MIEQLPARAQGIPLSLGPARFTISRDALSVACELAAYAALAGLVTWRWMLLATPSPAGRGVAIVAIATAGAALLSALGRAGRPRGLARAAGAGITIAFTLGGLLTAGLPAHTVVPPGWDNLASGLETGLPGAFGASFPYIEPDPWIRIVILCGAPLVLGLGAWLGFAPGSERRSRAWALATLVCGFAIATALRAPSEPVAAGLALFAAIAAWLWLGRIVRSGARPAAGLLAAAAVLAVPFAAALDRDGPLLDYQAWDLSLSSASAQSVSYTWDQTYGPLKWSRTGKTLMTVSGSSPQYWRTSVLENFNGLAWTAAGNAVDARFELPDAAERAFSLKDRINALDPRWVHRATFNIDALSSDLVVAPGSVLKLSGLAITSGGPAGLSLPAEDSLGDGDSYTVTAYEPDPSPTDLRFAPKHLDPGLRQYTEIGLPEVVHAPVPTDSFGRPLQRGTHPSPTVSVSTIAMPLFGESAGSPDRRLLAKSAYGDVYALARRLTRHSKTEYDAVTVIERHLRNSYSYDESPPVRKVPLRAFLFRDRIGYCQQFSGAMALMLRSLGIPARVATGFSPGIPNPKTSGVVVRDLDAHSWVEVYFNDIGWVPFDPTPAASPAAAQSAGAGGSPAREPRPQLAGQKAGGPLPLNQRRAGAGSGDGPPWALIVAVAAGGLAALAVAALVSRRRRFLALSSAERAAVSSRELGDLVGRLGLDDTAGVTLLALERRLQMIAGPAAADYVRALRLTRFGRGEAKPPTLHDRRELRRSLFGHGGRRRFLAGIVALPPGAPR